MQNKTLVVTAAPAEKREIGFIKSRKSDDKRCFGKRDTHY